MPENTPMTCEQHPEKEWPHDDCIGPGVVAVTERYPYRAVYILAHGMMATIPDATYERCESAARQLLDRLVEHGFKVTDGGSPRRPHVA